MDKKEKALQNKDTISNCQNAKNTEEDAEEDEENTDAYSKSEFTDIEECTKIERSEYRKLMADKIFFEIDLIKREIKDYFKLNKINRPLLNFEKDFRSYENKVKFFDPVLVHKSTSKKINKENDIIRSTKSILNIDDEIENELKENIRIFDENIIADTMNFFNQAKELPLLYILKSAKRVLSDDEWNFAYEEQEIIKKIERYERLKNKYMKNVNLIDTAKIEERNEEIKNEKNKNQIKRRKLVAKALAEECKKFYDQNVIYKDNQQTILNFGQTFYPQSIEINDNDPKNDKEANEYYKKRFNDVFIFLKNNKTKNVFEPPRIISNEFVMHSSHLATQNKIPPELSKTTNSCEISEYKNRMLLRHNENNSFVFGRAQHMPNNSPYNYNSFSGNYPYIQRGYNQNIYSPNNVNVNRMNQGGFYSPYQHNKYQNGFSRGPINGNFTFNPRNDDQHNRRDPS